jgi:tRNA nucleotidyltransferase/poly(A) polymerase
MDQADVLEAIDMPNNRVGMVRTVDGNDPVVALTALLNTVGGLDALRTKWKFSNDVYSKARFILENRHLQLTESDAQRMLANPKVRKDHVFALLQAQGRQAMADKLAQWEAPEFPVNGSDLIAAGLKQGPEMGRALATLRNEWEASGFKLTKDQLLQKV